MNTVQICIKSDLDTGIISNTDIETILAENRDSSPVISKFTILNIWTQPVSDLSIYLTKNLSEIDAIIITSTAWITCKFK